MTNNEGDDDHVDAENSRISDTEPRTTMQLDSETLFGTNEVILIDHEGTTYKLRKTRLGKLILTK